MFRRRTLYGLLCFLATFLLGTVVVLSSISYYLAIPIPAYITELELAALHDDFHEPFQRIPKIIHQTWKSETLPSRWTNVSVGCRDMNPDYEYILWTDASAREFIAQNYDWFLDTYDGYTYPIQRADAIRYFVLYHYGGIYVDLDIGCLRPMDDLLYYPVILPRTKPVGVSNDLMFSEKGHPFMGQVIHNLMGYDYSWILNYPTVMFSTGPMFLSAQFGVYSTNHPPTLHQPSGEVRILPKSLYGKNAKPEEAPHSFFAHYYGSSWHSDDAAFIGFLGTWGHGLMWLGLFVLVGGLVRMAFLPNAKPRSYRVAGYEVVIPRWSQRKGRWYIDLGWMSLPASGSNTAPASPMSLPQTPSDDEDVQMLPMYDPRASRAPPALSLPPPLLSQQPSPRRSVFDAVRRAGAAILDSVFSIEEPPSTPSRSRRRRVGRAGEDVLYFLPAIFPSQGDAMEVPFAPHVRSPTFSRTRGVSRTLSSQQLAHEKQRHGAGIDRPRSGMKLDAKGPEPTANSS